MDSARVFEHGERRGYRRGAGCRHDPVEALALDDRFEKDRADRIARRIGVRLVEHGHQIVDHAQALAGQQRRHLVGRRAVAGIDDLAVDRRAADRRGVGQHVIGVASVGAAGEQQDVRRRGFELGDVLAGEVEGERPGQLGAGRLRGDPADLHGHFGNQPDGRDGQPALGGGGVVQRRVLRTRPGHAFQDREEALGKVAGRGRTRGPFENLHRVAVDPERRTLGPGRADVDGHGDHERAATSRFRHSATWGSSTVGGNTRS